MISTDMLHLGQLVYSTQGRDQGQAYLVYKIAETGDYVYLVDGKKRTLKNPKKKNIKHIARTNWIADDLKEKFMLEVPIKKEVIFNALSNGIKAIEEAKQLGQARCD